MSDSKSSTIYVARVVLECTSVLCIGSGFSGLDEDMAVRTDHNGLPCIPATGITGALKSILSENWKEYFGGEKKEEKEEKEDTKMLGSKVILSDAYLLDDEMKVHLVY